MSITWADLKGALVLIKVHDDTVRADVVVLDGDREGFEYTNGLITPKVLQAQLAGYVGGWVIGRVTQGQGRAWMLSRATEADRPKTRQYLAKAPRRISAV